MTVLGLITARGGSKGIPRKNIAPCAGKPLIAYTVEAALRAKRLDMVALSTEDPEISEVVEALGLETPFLRPSDLATDMSLMPEVLLHALDWYEEKGQVIDAIALLQPTSPLRKSIHIDEAIDLFHTRIADTVVSLEKVPHQFSRISVMRMDDEGNASLNDTDTPLISRKQDKPVVYGRNGPAVLVTRSEIIRQGRLYGDRTIGYVMDRISSIDIDEPEDLLIAEALIKCGFGEQG